MDIRSLIWKNFRVKHRDNLPLWPWAEITRDNLAQLFAEAGYTRGAEIGVQKGIFSNTLLSCNPNLTLLCIDPWTPYSRTSQEKQDMFLRCCKRRLAGYKHEIMRMTSIEALSHVPDGSLDFVYIDGLHDFDNVIMDIIGWSKKVKSGGIVSGHDYCNFYQGGVVCAVDAYTRSHNIAEWYITREIQHSWFWVKG